MKLRILIAVALSGIAMGEEVDLRSQYRDAATHEQLSESLRKFNQRDPMLKLERIEGSDPSVENIPVNLLDQSDIICFGGYATLVPKRAILAVPERFERYLELKPGTKIIGWLDFYAKNRGWITTVEVNRKQAQGSSEIAEKTRERIRKSSSLVVATMMGGPISVFPPQNKEEGAETAEVNTSKP